MLQAPTFSVEIDSLRIDTREFEFSAARNNSLVFDACVLVLYATAFSSRNYICTQLVLTSRISANNKANLYYMSSYSF